MKTKIATIALLIFTLIAPNFAHADIFSNLLIRYSWDNADTTYTTAGTILDTSGNAKNAAFTIAPPGTGSSTSAIINQGVNFTGINNAQNGSARVASGALVIGTGDFSISVWAKAANNAFSNIAQTYNSGAVNNGWAFYWNNGALTWGVEATPAAQVITKTVTMDGVTWHHFVVTYSQVGRMVIYVDGVATTTTTTSVPTGNITNANAQPRIGGTFASNPAQNISLDEMCFYARELSAADVTALYNGGTGATCTGSASRVFKSLYVQLGQLFTIPVGVSWGNY